MKTSEKRYLFIAGQPKAGTSSLYKWLLQHPEICGSNLKEARFFLDESYPLAKRYVFDGSNLDEYMHFFDSPDKSILMDATPDYLYSENALAAASALPEARAVVILRDPVERIISAFRFFKQGGRIPADMSLSDYVHYQDQNSIKPDTPVQFRALDHCRTDFYLNRWKAAYGERLLVLKFEDLKEKPLQSVNRVLDFIGLDSCSFDDDSLRPENVTKVARSPILSRIYNISRRKLSQVMMAFPGVKAKLKPLSVYIRKLLYKELADSAPVADSKTLAIIRSWSGVEQ